MTGRLIKDEGVEAIGVEFGECQAIFQADGSEQGREYPVGTTIADVVKANVELIVLASKDGAVAPGQVMLFQDKNLLAHCRQVGGGRQPAESGSNHDHVVLCHFLPRVQRDANQEK